jgi:hypothetical protein
MFGLRQPLPLDGGLLEPEKENSIELRAESEQEVALLVEKALLSPPKDENETAELGGSVAEPSLIRLRFAQRISTPFSPSEV